MSTTRNAFENGSFDTLVARIVDKSCCPLIMVLDCGSHIGACCAYWRRNAPNVTKQHIIVKLMGWWYVYWSRTIIAMLMRAAAKQS